MFGPKLGMIVSNVYVIACVVAAMPHAARSAISCAYSGFELAVHSVIFGARAHVHALHV